MSKKDFNEAVGDYTNETREGAGRYSPEMWLFKNRVIILAGEVNDQLALNVIAQVKHLEATGPGQPITIYVNSPGGSVISGMAMFDVMRGSTCPIFTIGNGMQASMGSIMLAAGDERRMTENSTLMIHQIMSGNRGGTQASDLEISLGYTTRLHESLKNVYVEFTGLNHAFWDIVMERDTYLTAQQALKMGFIQEILVAPEVKRGPYAVEAKRAISRDRKQALAEIETMGVREIREALANGQGSEGRWGRYRPELVTKLSEFPEFWTKQRRAEAKATAKAASNDDVKAQPAAKAAAGKSKKGPAPQI
jgi:ATP-dependent Clp protease protease subunit